MNPAVCHRRPFVDHHDGLHRRARELPRLSCQEMGRVLSAVKAQYGPSGLFLLAWQLASDLLAHAEAALADYALAAVRDGGALVFLRVYTVEERSMVFAGQTSRYFYATAEDRGDAGVSLVRALALASASVAAAI